MKRTREAERRAIEYRYAFTIGYEQGARDAVPIKEYTKTLLEIGDPRVVKKIQKWAESEHRKKQAEGMTKAQLCMMCVNNPNNGGECRGGNSECESRFKKRKKVVK